MLTMRLRHGAHLDAARSLRHTTRTRACPCAPDGTPASARLPRPRTLGVSRGRCPTRWSVPVSMSRSGLMLASAIPSGLIPHEQYTTVAPGRQYPVPHTNYASKSYSGSTSHEERDVQKPRRKGEKGTPRGHEKGRPTHPKAHHRRGEATRNQRGAGHANRRVPRKQARRGGQEKRDIGSSVFPVSPLYHNPVPRSTPDTRKPTLRRLQGGLVHCLH